MTIHLSIPLFLPLAGGVLAALPERQGSASGSSLGSMMGTFGYAVALIVGHGTTAPGCST